jgi:HlyD family secretion protein
LLRIDNEVWTNGAMHMKTSLLIVSLALVAIVGIAAAMSFSPGVPVESAAAQRLDIRQYVDERGETRLPQTYLITMPFAGRLEKIQLEVGDPVGTQTAVARIVPADLQHEVDEATAAVERLQKSIEENVDKKTEDLTYEQTLKMVDAMLSTVEAAENRTKASQSRASFAEDFLAKMRRLQSTSARSEEDVDRAEVAEVEAKVQVVEDRLTVAMTKSMLAATQIMPKLVMQYMADQDLKTAVLEKEKAEAQARLAQVLTKQERGNMYSPVEGVVLEKLIENERYLPAGEVLLRIGQLEELEIEADILSQDVVDVRPGQSVEIYGPAVAARLGAGVAGTVKRIYPAGFTKVSSLGVEEQRVKVIIAFDPAALAKLRSQLGLGVDYRVRVRVFTAEAKNAITVPRSALFRGADGAWQLFVIRDGRARRVSVDVGLMNDEHVQIVKGINEKEAIVLAPDTSLTDGAKVSTSR